MLLNYRGIHTCQSFECNPYCDSYANGGPSDRRGF